MGWSLGLLGPGFAFGIWAVAMALLDLNYGSGRRDQFETAFVFSAPFLSKEYARYAGLSRCIIYCRYFVL